MDLLRVLEEMDLLSQLKRGYDRALDLTDERSRTWPMMSTPMIPVVTMVMYVAMVKFGPALMKDRPAFNLQWTLFVYNFVLVFLSAYMAYEFLMAAIEADYSLQCQVVDYSYSTPAMRMLRVTWLYYVSKYVEIADTVFFILRKKTNQITVLHVWHHSTIIFFWWFGTAYTPGGQAFFNTLLNSSVHVVMYTYYGLAVLGPSVYKYLWWKKYLTKFQIVQFVLISVHCTYNTLTDCPYPKVFNFLATAYAIILILLFANFYRQAYKPPQHATKGMQHNNGHVSGQQNGVTSHRPHSE